MSESAYALPSYRALALGRRGAVCANHPIAARAGLDVLARGGNAFDAAIAVAAAIAVVEPAMNGVGGDGFYLLFRASDQRAITVHAAAGAAAAATPERFADGMPYSGPLAAMPPGAVAGWTHVAREYGTMPLRQLFEAGIHYAREGFAATPRFCADVREMASMLAKDPGCSAAYLPDGKQPEVGATIRNPALARTLEAMASGGSDVLFGGPVGADLASFVERGGGIFTLDDLAAHAAEEIAPLRTEYRGLTVLESDRPTMGFALNVELALAEHFDLAAMDFLSADHVHTLVEIKKIAFRAREQYAGDPRFVDSTLDEVLSRAYAERHAQSIDPARATDVQGRPSREGDTTYFAVVDGAGNAVSGIQSLAAPFGACAMCPKTGILLNNRMTWFHLEPDHPNVLAPGKRVRNTINTPMALAGGRVRYVWGTPGGDSQTQVSLQTLSAAVDHGLDPQQAVEAPRWVHFQPGTSSYYPHLDTNALLVESRFEGAVIEALRERGHNAVTVGPLDGQGCASMIIRDDDGLLRAGADPRRDGWSEAF